MLRNPGLVLLKSDQRRHRVVAVMSVFHLIMGEMMGAEHIQLRVQLGLIMPDPGQMSTPAVPHPF
jgi:hypothetical protein